jgi:hypothetical protein
MLGSGILSHQGNMARKGAMSGAGRALQLAYKEMLDEQEDRFADISDTYSETYEGAIDDFGANYQGVLDRLNTQYGDLIARYSSGSDEALAAYDVGRDSTIAATQQATENATRRQVASNAFTGLGNTTFGNAAVAGIERQGALQEGVIHEQYASGRAGMLTAKNQGLASIMGNRIGQTAVLGGKHMSGLASLQTGYAGGLSQLGMTGLNQYLQIAEGPIRAQFDTQMAIAQMPTGWDAAAGVLGGIGGGLASGAAGGFFA